MKQRYLWLDAARGFAAVFVVLFHLDAWLGFAPLFTSAYLAVDLFFLMSGFVLAHAYEDKLASGRLGFAPFVAVRLIRLYPLYAMATVLGLLYFILKIAMGAGDAPRIADLPVKLLFGALFVPSPDPAVPSGMFPFAPSAWSLSLELLVNLVYGALLFRLRTAWLAVFTAVGSALLLIAAVGAGGFDLGWGWSTLPAGLARTAASFGAGLLIWRLKGEGPRSALPVQAVLLAIVLALALVPNADLLTGGLMIGLLFPALLLVNPTTEPTGWVAAACHELGRASYGVYILHTPLLLLFGGVYKTVLGADPADAAPWAGVPLTFAVLATSVLLTIWFDEPVRRLLNKAVKRRHMIEDLRGADPAGVPPPHERARENALT